MTSEDDQDRPCGEVENQVVEGQPDRTQRPPRVQRNAPAPLAKRNPLGVDLLTNHVTQTVLRTLLDGRDYIQFPEQQIAEYRESPGTRGEVVIPIAPGHEVTWEHVLSALMYVGDDVVDTFCAILALAINANGDEVWRPFYVDLDDIVWLCQQKWSNRTNTAEQRAAVIASLNALARSMVTVTVPGKRRGRELRLHSAIVALLGTVGEYSTETGECVWLTRQIKIGDWARLAPPLSCRTAGRLR